MEQATGEDVTRLAEEVGATLRRLLAESPQMAQLRSRIRNLCRWNCANGDATFPPSSSSTAIRTWSSWARRAAARAALSTS